MGWSHALDDDALTAAADALRDANGNQAEAAIALGIPRTTFQARIARAASRGLLGTQPVLPGYVMSRISTRTDAAGNTTQQTVVQKPESSGVFNLPDGHVIKGVSSLVNADGSVVQQWIKTRAELDGVLDAIRTTVDELKKDLPRVAPTKGPDHANELLLNQYTLTDLHFGMLAWAEETGGANYDLQEAERLLMAWFSAAIAMAPNAAVGVLAQLGDLMHHDSLISVTPEHANVLDADSRLQKIIRVVIRCVRRIIAMMLEKYPSVHVIMASANHDPASSAWMRELLYAMYEDEPRITIDNSPDVYYAYEWGKTALFYHHGHKRNINTVDSVFAGKFREIFGRCPKSYGHIGHKHDDEVKESNLMKVERHRTLAPPDAYASSGGWISGRDAKVITYHKEFGEVSRSIISPEMIV